MTGVNQSIFDSMDYLPFGEQIAGGTGSTHKFTGYPRDSESDLDYSMFRHYSSRQGRFMQPDPYNFGASIANPQSWNGYAYTLNNPLAYIDPTGLDCVYFNDDGTGVESIDTDSNSQECTDNGGDWINGTVTSWSYNPGTDTFNFGSSDGNYNYYTTANAPGSQLDGSSCYGDCDLTYSESAIIPSPLWAFVTSFFSPAQLLRTTYNSFVNPNGCDRLMASTLAEDLSPFPSRGPSSTDVAATAAPLAYAGGVARAYGYSISRGLVQPWKSSTFRGLMGQAAEGAEAAGQVALPAAIGYATLDSVGTSVYAAATGTCH